MRGAEWQGIGEEDMDFETNWEGKSRQEPIKYESEEERCPTKGSCSVIRLIPVNEPANYLN